MINFCGKGDSANSRVVEKDPQREGIPDEFWETNDSSVNGQKKKDIPSRDDRSSLQENTVNNNGTEFVSVKLRLKEISRGQILKSFYNAQKLDFTLDYGGH